MSGRISEFHEQGCDVLGISTDTIDTHQRWLTTTPDQGGLGPIEFPLASDADGAVCKRYGLYVERQHMALRGLFIIDPNSVLQYQVVHSLSVGRSSQEVLRVLEALQSGGLCPGEHEIGQPSLDVLAELRPNRVIGQYQVEAELGSGTFGTVFLARDLMLDRKVALKVLRSRDRVATDALLAEARAAAAFNHPNACTVYSVDTSSGAAMIVMEYIDGQPLSRRIESERLAPSMVAELARQIATGMASAHAAGVVHGDLKPANLMVTAGDIVKIMDFGLARRVAPAQWQAETLPSGAATGGGLSGTPSYMAPELTRGEPSTPASDVFALGLVIYEMLTGRPAVSGKNFLELLRGAAEFDASPLVAELPEPFARIVRESLVSEPAERRITMDQIARHLRDLRDPAALS